jgi:hypothetical protein
MCILARVMAGTLAFTLDMIYLLTAVGSPVAVNECRNIPYLLLELFCFMPLNRGFMYFFKEWERNPRYNMSLLFDYRTFQLSFAFSRNELCTKVGDCL